MNALENIPFVFAYLSTTLTNVTGSGTGFTIPFNVIQRQQGNGYSTATGIYTAPVTGPYFIYSSFFLTSVGTSSSNNLISNINVNGTTYKGSEISTPTIKTPTNTLTWNVCLPYITVQAGQQISIVPQVNNGTAATVGIAGAVSPMETWLYISYLP